MAARKPVLDTAVGDVLAGRMTAAEAARRYGVSSSSVSRRLRPAQTAAYERARRGAKRAWERSRAHDRCPGCGRRKTRKASFCATCARAIARVRADGLLDLYRAGYSLNAIAERTGRSRASVAAFVARRRAEGYDLPYRGGYGPAAVAAMAAGGRRAVDRRRARESY